MGNCPIRRGFSRGQDWGSDFLWLCDFVSLARGTLGKKFCKGWAGLDSASLASYLELLCSTWVVAALPQSQPLFQAAVFTLHP